MTLSFVTIDTWTLIFTWINLLILFLLMKKLLFKPIINIIKQRDEEIQAMYSDAQKDKDESEKLRLEYTEKLTNAKDEAGKIVTNASKTAELRSEQILKDAQSTVSNMLKKADEEILREKKAAVDDIKSDISDMAVMVASKVIEKDLSDSEHLALVEKCINEIGEAL